MVIDQNVELQLERAMAALRSKFGYESEGGVGNSRLSNFLSGITSPAHNGKPPLQLQLSAQSSLEHRSVAAMKRVRYDKRVATGLGG